MDKALLIAGTIVIIILSGFGSSGIIPPAYATQSNIDDFTEEQELCDLTQDGLGVHAGGAEGNPPNEPATVKDHRECELEITADNTDPQEIVTRICMVEVVTGGVGRYTLDSDDLIDCVTELHYGEDMVLSQDYTSIGGTEFRVELLSTDIGVDITVMVEDGDTDTDSVMKSTVASGAQNVIFPFAEFAGNINFGDIHKIWVKLDPGEAGDFSVDNILVPSNIGGEMIPVNTSALLLAGAEMNSFWILPLIAAIGVGAFIYSRKRN